VLIIFDFEAKYGPLDGK